MYCFDISSSLISDLKQTSVTEWLIFTTALVYVVLAAVENVWCWLFGIISSFLSIYLCFTGNLFLESGLQVFYVAIGIYGWYQWLYGSADKKLLAITSLSAGKTGYLILIGIALWIPFGFVAHRYSTQVMPYLDAFITAFSIVAAWMTAKKMIENWLFWIVIDALAIFLYAYRGFHLIALLYILYTVLAFAGYYKWKTILKK